MPIINWYAFRAQNRSPTRTQAPVPDSARLLFDSPKVEFTPWAQTSHDPNDTATDSAWYDARIGYGGGDVGLLAEKRAAQLVEDHEATPSVVHLDVLGRPFLSIAHNIDLNEDAEYFETRSVLDIQGNVLEVIDARDNTAESRTYGMLGQSLVVSSEDVGDRWTLLNALGQPMRSWDSRSQRFSFSYDTLRRPVDRTVSVSGGSEKLLGRIVYGDLLSTPRRTRITLGGCIGSTTALAWRPRWNSTSRATRSRSSGSWSPARRRSRTGVRCWGESTIAAMATAATSLLDYETFAASSERDVVNRVLTVISPDDSKVIDTYDEGRAPQTVEVEHHGSRFAGRVERLPPSDRTIKRKTLRPGLLDHDR